MNAPPLWRIGEAVIELPELDPEFEPEQHVQLMGKLPLDRDCSRAYGR